MTNAQCGPVDQVGVRVTTPGGRSTSLVASSDSEMLTEIDSAGLTRAEAAELTARISSALEHAEVLIAQAYLRRAWEPLGLLSWNAYVETHFGDRPMLAVPRLDRPEIVRSLSESGLPGRAIARAIGVDEGTVRNDLKARRGAENSAPDVVEAVEVICPTCGQAHPADVGTCPYLADAFGTIVDLDARADRRFGPGVGEAHSDLRDFDDVIDQDDDLVGVDTEADPLPDDDAAVSRDAEAARRTRRIRTAVERVAALRDDLDELHDVLAGVSRDLTDWPAGSPTRPPSGLGERLQLQVAAIQEALPNLPASLESASKLAVSLQEPHP
ncbi:MAG: hypothetical protein M3Y35_05925 [Actinomycetota bacterium]|nr:hypothetical protein [Actinomycetota bacterium]